MLIRLEFGKDHSSHGILLTVRKRRGSLHGFSQKLHHEVFIRCFAPEINCAQEPSGAEGVENRGLARWPLGNLESRVEGPALFSMSAFRKCPKNR